MKDRVKVLRARNGGPSARSLLQEWWGQSKKLILQRLKPQESSTSFGTAKAVPFQNRFGARSRENAHV